MTPTPDSIAVMLDRERRIAFTYRARYRMGGLERPFDLADLGKSKKSFAALVAWLWACLVPGDAHDFATPEDLAPHVPSGEGAAALMEALLAAVRATMDEKKPVPSGAPGPLPAVTSG